MNKNTKIYRLWEMIPGFFAWMVILFPIWGAFIVPKAVAYFVIAFLVYWLYQSFKTSEYEKEHGDFGQGGPYRGCSNYRRALFYKGN